MVQAFYMMDGDTETGISEREATMKPGTARALCALNNEFYWMQAASFSATREAPWPGWRRVLDSLPLPSHGGAAGAPDDPGASDIPDAPNSPGAPTDSDAPDAPSALDVLGAPDALGAPDTPGAPRGEGRLRVLDVACGNLRFERFLAAECPFAFAALAVDSCDEMALAALRSHDFGEGSVEFLHVDAIERLLERGECGGAPAFPACESGSAPFDAVVCFGFMHHIPGADNRRRFLGSLVDAVRPGGIVAVSLWRFMDDGRLARKARSITDEVRGRAEGERVSVDLSDLEAGDYLLGWKDDSRALRYCHHFDDGEISSLVEDVSDSAELADCFQADGKGGRLNEYLVFRRR